MLANLCNKLGATLVVCNSGVQQRCATVVVQGCQAGVTNGKTCVQGRCARDLCAM